MVFLKDVFNWAYWYQYVPWNGQLWIGLAGNGYGGTQS